MSPARESAAAEARLRAIIDSSLDAVVAIDAESRVVDWSRHAERVFGWAARDVVGRTLYDTIIPPAYHEAHRRGMARFLATGEGPILGQRVRITALRRDGREIPVELTVSAVQNARPALFSAFIRDLTEERAAERRLAAEREVTRVLSETSSLPQAAPRVLAAIGGILGWDVGVFWSLDAGAGELRCVGMWHVPRGDFRAFEEANAGRVFRRGEGLPGVAWERGTATWVVDVAANGQMPRAPGALASGLRSAILFPLCAGSELLGILEFFHRERLEPDPALLAMGEAIGRDIAQAVKRIRAEEERDRARAELQHANAALQAINRALAERTSEAERARAAADEANRAKSDFLATMSHELRTPLNAVLGYADLLDLGVTGPVTAAQRVQLRRIRDSGLHLLGLVNEVLDLAKVEAGRMDVEQEVGEMRVAALEALTMARPQAEARGLRLDHRCDEGLGYVGDPVRVRQVMLNLLSNAIKFTDPGGTVSLSCRLADAPDAGASLVGPGPWVRVDVEDSGIGIAPAELPRIFQPFVQADQGPTRQAGGTGLGLAISCRLARLMDGDLTVRSEPGKGSCFTLWLPAAASPRTGTAPAKTPATEARGLAEAGGMLRLAAPGIVAALVERLRTDPAVPAAHGLSEKELEDHTSTYLADIGQVLTVMAESDAEPTLMEDGSAIQRLIADKHGAQRARLGWGEAELEREFDVLDEELTAAMRGGLPPGAPDPPALTITLRLLRQARTVSVRGLRAAQPVPPPIGPG